MPDQPPVTLIDARGLSCPMPLMRARQALMLLKSGAVICVLATDPGSRRDFEDFAEVAGHELLSLDETEGLLRIVLKKG